VSTYRTVESSIYADPKVKKLPSDGKFLFVYLLTNEMTDVTGLYHAPYVLISSQMGITEKRIKELLDLLQEQGLVLHDDETEVVWVISMLNYQLHSSKVLKSALARIRSLHSPDLILWFLLHYETEIKDIDSYEDMVAHYADMHIQKYGYVPVPVPFPGTDSVPEDRNN
jgi:hypothetical protein